MNILIVGGGGQDGNFLQQQLNAGDANILSISRGDYDLNDFSQVGTLVKRLRPIEVYYIAAHHHSAQDRVFENDLATYNLSRYVHVDGVVTFLEAIRLFSPSTRLFYASSAHVFGKPAMQTQDESTPFNPQSIYAITKAAGVHFCRHYREHHGVFASCGILYNHVSALSKPSFVIPRIIRSAIAISKGVKSNLLLGNLSSQADWGYAPDYVDAMIRILRLPEADDFVIATGITHSVQSVVEKVFALLNLNWEAHVEECPDILTESDLVFCGNSEKLRSATNWRPSISFNQMLELLVHAQYGE